jgi:hypothetical protein
MENHNLKRHFERMGARLALRPSLTPARLAIDIRESDLGSYSISNSTRASCACRPRTCSPSSGTCCWSPARRAAGRKSSCAVTTSGRGSCSAVPNSGRDECRGGDGVVEAALVRTAQERVGVSPRNRGKRRTHAYVRQGEWFFVPAPGAK